MARYKDWCGNQVVQLSQREYAGLKLCMDVMCDCPFDVDSFDVLEECAAPFCPPSVFSAIAVARRAIGQLIEQRARGRLADDVRCDSLWSKLCRLTDPRNAFVPAEFLDAVDDCSLSTIH